MPAQYSRLAAVSLLSHDIVPYSGDVASLPCDDIAPLRRDDTVSFPHGDDIARMACASGSEAHVISQGVLLCDGFESGSDGIDLPAGREVGRGRSDEFGKHRKAHPVERGKPHICRDSAFEVH